MNSSSHFITVVDGVRPRLREPGLLRLEPGTERYRVRGGGATVVALSAGDRITITDLEGRQRCELLVFSRDGCEDAAALGARAEARPEGLARVLSCQREEDRMIVTSLGQFGIDILNSRAVQLFG